MGTRRRFLGWWRRGCRESPQVLVDPGIRSFWGGFAGGLLCWAVRVQMCLGCLQGAVSLKQIPLVHLGGGCGVGGLPQCKIYTQPFSFSRGCVRLVFTRVPSSEAHVSRDGMLD